MASRFLGKLNYNEIGNEQRSVILTYIIKRIFYNGKKPRSLSASVLLIFTFYYNVTLLPEDFFLICGWCVVESRRYEKSAEDILTRLDPWEIVYIRGVYQVSE